VVRTQTPVFVVSSGRAGSTLLARMIHRHPRLLCVSDLFEPVGEVPYFDRRRVVDGEGFFRVLASPSFPQRIAYWRAQPTSELLFLHEDDDMVSLLTSYTLPFLTGGDPMGLFEELREATAKLAEASMADQLIRVFDWLRDRFGKQLWVERTGGSLPHMRQILETWPDAKVIHNFRDPRETAISMMTGSFFRLYLELEKNPDLDAWDWDRMPPRTQMAKMLNRWMVDGVAALDGFPRDQQMSLSYEQLMKDTAGTLLELIRFFFDREPTAEDETWAEQETTVIRPAPLRFASLPSAERAELQAACRGALDALGYE
jgi:hypothetical protein